MFPWLPVLVLEVFEGWTEVRGDLGSGRLDKARGDLEVGAAWSSAGASVCASETVNDAMLYQAAVALSRIQLPGKFFSWLGTFRKTLRELPEACKGETPHCRYRA